MPTVLKKVSKKNDLESAKKILKAFMDERIEMREIQRGITPHLSTIGEGIPMSDLAQVEVIPTIIDPYWEKENARAWIYTSSRYIPLMRRPKRYRIHPFYEQAAGPLFEEWTGLFLDVQNCPTYCIPSPDHEETLQSYLEKLRSIVVDEGERRKIWWLSLRSFTEFLRKKAKLIDSPYAQVS